MLTVVELLRVLLISAVTIISTSLIFYEIMYLAWAKIGHLKASHRIKIFILVITIFAAHTFCVWFYGFVYYAMHNLGLGSVTFTDRAETMTNIADFIYFSSITYSSLGYDNILAHKEIQFLTGVEVLNGLVLIAWSASYTYIMMEKFWDIRKKGK